MASTYTTNKRIEKPGFNDYVNTWDVPVNADWDVVDKAFGGIQSVSLTNVNVTLTQTQCQNVNVLLTGTLSGNVTIYFPASVAGFYIVRNTTSGAYTVTLASDGGGAATVTAVRGYATLIWSNGTNVYLANDVIAGTGLSVSGNTVSLSAPVSVANGGTGRSTLTANYVLLGNTTTAVQMVAPGTSGNVLTSNGTTWASASANFGRGASVVKTGSQSITTATTTALTWQSAVYDSSSVYSGATPSRLTVPSGVSLVSLQAGVIWSPNGSGYRQVYIRKNGSLANLTPSDTTPTIAGINVNQNVASGVQSVTPGDYFETCVYQDSGSTLSVDNSAVCWFSMTILR